MWKDDILKKKKSIEEKFQRLTEISDQIEGDTPIEVAISLYKEGLALVEDCGSQLRKYEADVLVLKKNADEMFSLEPFGKGYRNEA